MEPTEIKSGPADVIASGTVISFKKNPIEILFGFVNERLKLIIEFEEDKENKETHIQASSPSEDTLILKLIKWGYPRKTYSFECGKGIPCRKAPISVPGKDYPQRWTTP